MSKAKINFNNLLMLAPLAGYSDLPFRGVVKKFGVDITVSEMISSHALKHNSFKTLKMIEKNPLESPYSVQISGNKEEIIKDAVLILNEKEGIDIIDLNCGCPAPKVSSHGSGSALLKDLNLLVKLIQTIKLNSNKQYTSIKVRLGFDKKIPLELSNALNDSGVDFVVVHGRTKCDAYKKDRIDYSSIALMKNKLNIPLIANGDIDSYAKAKEVMEITNANGVMIGRAALKEPWIFYQLKNNLSSMPNVVKRDVVLEHFHSMISFYGDRGCIMFRKNLHNYALGESNAVMFRNKVNSIDSIDEMRDLINDFFNK